MTRAVLYVAHCLAPTPEELSTTRQLGVFVGGPVHGDRAATQYEVAVHRCALRLNLERAMRWLSWLRKSFPETTFIAPWIASVLSGDDDADPAQREAGFVDACATIERCDGIVLCGPRISSEMRREIEHGQKHSDAAFECELSPDHFKVYDMTGDRAYMPSDVELRTDQTWAEWAKALRV